MARVDSCKISIRLRILIAWRVSSGRASNSVESGSSPTRSHRWIVASLCEWVVSSSMVMQVPVNSRLDSSSRPQGLVGGEIATALLLQPLEHCVVWHLAKRLFAHLELACWTRRQSSESFFSEVGHLLGSCGQVGGDVMGRPSGTRRRRRWWQPLQRFQDRPTRINRSHDNVVPHTKSTTRGPHS